MNGKRFYIFIEGNDDERFFNHILKKKFERIHGYVEFWKYAKVKPEKRIQFIRTVKHVKNWDYLFVTDIDQSPCVTEKKKEIMNQYSDLEENKIMVVAEEIETWYFVGVTEDFLKEIESPLTVQTPHRIIKEYFESIIPRGMTKLEFMLEILESYDDELAKKRSKSFAYIVRKFLRKKK